MLSIYVDADACPATIKEILFRAANRTQTPLVLIANHALSIPASNYISTYQVPKGFDVADNEIVKRVQTGDLVITSDIPLANEVIEKGCLALSPRGELYSQANIKARLTMRNFMETMRNAGVQTGGPATLSAAEKQTFASHLDQWLLTLVTKE